MITRFNLFVSLVLGVLCFSVSIVDAVDSEPRPPADSGTTSLPIPTMLPQLRDSLASDSLVIDSLADSLKVPEAYCSNGVRATLPPNFKKFGRVRFDPGMITLTDPVNTLVRCCIDAYGAVIGAEVVRSSTIPLLDEIALQSAFLHKAEPGQVDDEYVISSALFRVTFKPGKESKILYGRYNVGQLDFVSVGLDTLMPRPVVRPRIDSLIPESLLVAASAAPDGSKEKAALDSARLVLAAQQARIDSAKGITGALAQGKGKNQRKPSQPRGVKKGNDRKDEEPIPEVDAVIQVDKLARVVKSDRVAYPKEEAKNGLEGTVWIASLIDSRGRGREHRIWKSSGNSKFDQAALQSVATFKFEAAKRGDQAIMTWLKHKIEFRLTDLE